MRNRLRGRWIAIGALVLILGTLTQWWARAATTQAPAVSISVSTAVPAFTPRLALVQVHEWIVVANHSNHVLRLTTTPHTPLSIRLSIPRGQTARFRLSKPGYYHFYDAAIAQVIDYTAGNDVVRALPDAPNPDLPAQGWIVVPGATGIASTLHIYVPAGQDLIDTMVGVVRMGGSVIIHNYDGDPHNLVTDPADPAGSAFELLGTAGEPAIDGAQRRLTFTIPGLYHVYCSIHTMIMGRAGGWEVVMPRDSHASGYHDHNPMEGWFLVVPQS
jgi:hypothetical protein